MAAIQQNLDSPDLKDNSGVFQLGSHFVALLISSNINNSIVLMLVSVRGSLA